MSRPGPGFEFSPNGGRLATPRALSLQAAAAHDSQHMAQKVRALSYRVPLLVRVGNRGFTFSISGWNGAV